MKIFFYKTLFVALVFFIIFKITIGSALKEVEIKFKNLSSKENVELVKDKLRKEMKDAISRGMKYSAKEYLAEVDFMERS